MTALIGTNESGKTNLLVPLWKLNPAQEGDINPLADYPRKRYTEIRAMQKKPKFIEANFELSDSLASKIADLTGASVDEVQTASVTRDFEGHYAVSFPDDTAVTHVPTEETLQIIQTCRINIEAEAPRNTEKTLKINMLSALEKAENQATKETRGLDKQQLESILKSLKGVNLSRAIRSSKIVPPFKEAIEQIQSLVDTFRPKPSENAAARQLVLDNLPSFVYYSNYGNLDSEIYLPHVIDNLKRSGLGTKEEARTRTLRVLFEFVKLKPEEIHELGRDFSQTSGQPTEDQLQKIADNKRERTILLQSASTDLTQKFRNWWRQGNYNFDFQADGDHFRIWVSDDKRPERIELEGRSTGLQWFLSFYLVFLVESANAHADAILLLDEPGLSLHPIAQRDLSNFFENLSNTNQILYTTHSPFMVDPDHLDRVKAVYVDDQGASSVSSDLRAGQGRSEQSQSIYPVHAALGLTVSDILFLGCQKIIVEGTSDQIYLSAIKNYLIGKGLITPKQEILFLPAGGVKGVGAVVSIVAGKDELYPYVLLDSDRSGQQFAKQLSSSAYKTFENRIIQTKDICGLENSEIEDLLPPPFLADMITRYFRKQPTEEDFSELVEVGQPIVPQVEQYAKENALELELGWKVEVAKAAKARLTPTKSINGMNETIEQQWVALFEKFED